MLAGLPVPDHAVEDLAEIVRAAGADDLADRLERAVTDDVKLLALTLGGSAGSHSSPMISRSMTSSSQPRRSKRYPGDRILHSAS